MSARSPLNGKPRNWFAIIRSVVVVLVALGLLIWNLWPRPSPPLQHFQQTVLLKDMSPDRISASMQMWGAGVHKLFGIEERRLETIAGRSVLIVDDTGEGIDKVLDVAAVRDYVTYYGANLTATSQQTGITLTKRLEEGVIVLIAEDIVLRGRGTPGITYQTLDGLWVSFVNVHPANAERLPALATELGHNFFAPEGEVKPVNGIPVMSGQGESVSFTLTFIYKAKVEGRPFDCAEMDALTKPGVPGGAITCLSVIGHLYEGMPGKSFFR